ncbi:MAG: murein L,D-transpeptidase catalytic domain-containing protein [Bdellovibrionales bacterium]
MQIQKSWLISLLALGMTLGSSALALPENPDIQSPEEIARAHAVIEKDFEGAIDPADFSLTDNFEILAAYPQLDPGHEVPADLLANAVAYFDANKSRFPNQAYITIVDFKPRSDKYRLYIINMADGSVQKFHTTHGVNSDKNADGYATIFGNVINSGMSSLGYVRTGEVYNGAYKRALRLDGLSSTNSNIRDRAVVFHGWDGVHEANVLQGMSHGCITLDWKIKDAAIDKIKEGSFMYVAQSAK